MLPAPSRPTYTNDSSGNTFAGYALPANEADAAADCTGGNRRDRQRYVLVPA